MINFTHLLHEKRCHDLEKNKKEVIDSIYILTYQNKKPSYTSYENPNTCM